MSSITAVTSISRRCRSRRRRPQTVPVYTGGGAPRHCDAGATCRRLDRAAIQPAEVPGIVPSRTAANGCRGAQRPFETVIGLSAPARSGTFSARGRRHGHRHELSVQVIVASVRRRREEARDGPVWRPPSSARSTPRLTPAGTPMAAHPLTQLGLPQTRRWPRRPDRVPR